MAVKYLGNKELVDPKTGQIYDFDIVSKNFDKMDAKGWCRVIMIDLMEAIEQIGNQKIKVLEFLIDNMDRENKINLTQKQIQKKTKISIQTISSTFKALKKANLIKKHGGLYVLNTSIISSYGSAKNNRYLTIEYNFTNKPIIEDEKEISKQEAKKLKDENLELKKQLQEMEKLKLELEEIKRQKLK